MADTGASFNRPYKPFGLNVKVPDVGEKTLKLAGGTLENIVKIPDEFIVTPFTLGAGEFMRLFKNGEINEQSIEFAKSLIG